MFYADFFLTKIRLFEYVIAYETDFGKLFSTILHELQQQHRFFIPDKCFTQRLSG
jgi:hypothetical protein